MNAPIDAGQLGKTAVLMGGSSAEREVSLMSGTGVLRALQSQGVQAFAFDPAARDLADLRREGFARAFIALHGRHASKVRSNCWAFPTPGRVCWHRLCAWTRP